MALPYRRPLAGDRFRRGWQERKHRQTLAQASFLLFGEDLSGPLYERIRHRAERTGSAGRGSQELHVAEAKVLRDWARKHRIDPEARARLEGWVRDYRRASSC